MSWFAQQDVAVQQQNQMKSQGKAMDGIILKMVKGETPYDQAAVNAALAALEADVSKIPAAFKVRIQGRRGQCELRIVAEDLAEQGRFRRQRCRPFAKAIAEAKGNRRMPLA